MICDGDLDGGSLLVTNSSDTSSDFCFLASLGSFCVLDSFVFLGRVESVVRSGWELWCENRSQFVVNRADLLVTGHGSV